MPPMRAAHSSDAACVPRCGEPIVNRGADLAALNRRLPRTVMTGHEQQDAVAARDRFFELAVDCAPCRVQVHPVQIENTVGFDGTRAEPPVPAAVERRSRPWPLHRHRLGLRNHSAHRRRSVRLVLLFSPFGDRSLSRERRNSGRHPRPERGLFRAEGSHAPRRPSAEAARPGRTPTFRRRSPSLPDRRPRRCRSGSAP